MSIQINGIDKPKNCFDCPCIDAEFEECAAKEHYLLPKDEYGAVLGGVPDWCPITELQTCNDAVSRQQAIDAFEKELTTGESKGKYVTICSAVSFEGAKQILEALPSAQSEHWIPCSERLPNEGHDVLITKESFKIKGYEQEIIKAKRSVDPRSGKIEWWSPEFGALTNKAVLAWMPLPAPYRKDGGKQ